MDFTAKEIKWYWAKILIIRSYRRMCRENFASRSTRRIFEWKTWTYGLLF